ncbi:anthranilate synthase component 1 [Labedella gwakjiensis]|uniref:aminodeoxychorismate synthase n=1 Tax=Labedella gwakjiensis TaxID=390269 RepID=A0A2P8H0D9_9MICO|nr:aminodeoxychorismate synthase component I [Labedella gwakjiensis]PSL39660.1 anthranilate synthase component 1 [Labedella gwakjiensis]RUQ85951.1 aminodeoxychorismate synthase component I [Labedella gwakjiensis]
MTPAHGPDDFEAMARRLVADEANVFWLDAGPDATDGWSYLGRGTRTLSARGGVVRVGGDVTGSDVLTTLSQLVENAAASDPAAASDQAAASGGPMFRGGWVGVLGYEYGAGLVGVPRSTSDLPDALFVECDLLWSLDHRTGAVTRILGDDTTLADMSGRPAVPPSSDAPSGAGPTVHWRHDRVGYMSAIAASLDAISRGDAYQVCLTNEAIVETPADPFEVYLRLRRENPAPHGCFLRIDDVAVAGCSPERFLAVSSDGAVETRPIKGTRRRDPDPHVDAELASELRSDEKERAENLMIVDLMRNDLGRVAALGSVDVPDLFAVESYPSVHQLVSTVTAQLAPGLTGIDAVRASFPAGSMTGAPKHRAMSLLHDLEGGPRGLYAGAIGWFGADGAVDLAMVIRSIVFADGMARIGTGGGITALSDPSREVDETLLKARPLLAALGAPATLPDPSA